MSATDVDKVRRRAEEAGQGHVFGFWNVLGPSGRERLVRQVTGLDLEGLGRLVAQAQRPAALELPAGLEPAPVVRLPDTEAERAEARRAAEAGEEVLRAGRVAALVVAGGQGTRLGWPGPKGTYPIGPVSGKSLFQLHAEKVVAARRRYGAPVPLLAMTSPDNDEATRSFFARHDAFGLPPQDLMCFCQGTMPAVDDQGRLLLDAPDHVAESPNGHGGVLLALVSSGSLACLRERGIAVISYIQVDNPLARLIDPVFIGRHALADAQMSSKVVRKRDAEEGVAVLGVDEGRLRVVEYSDLPPHLKYALRPDGRLLFEMGSIAIHILSVDFVEWVVHNSVLPYHVARKKLPFLDATGRRVEPTEPNAVKFEMFVFDALHLAGRSATMETAREEEFAPVKNAEGRDSPASAKSMMVERDARWLEAAGVVVPRDAAGQAAVPVEISPLLAAGPDEWVRRCPQRIDLEGPVYLAP